MTEKLSANLNLEDNSYITETAGFVPLEVKFKRFEQAGQVMQFSVSEFTSSDLRSIYLNPDFDITPEDDYEEIQEKLIARNEYILQLQKLKAKSAGNDVMAGTEEPKKNEEKESEKEE